MTEALDKSLFLPNNIYMPKHNALTFFLVIFVLVAIYFIYYFQYRTNAAPFISHSLKTETNQVKAKLQHEIKEKYVAGEVIVKLKQPISEFDGKTFNSPNSKDSAKAYAALNKTKLPSAITNVHKKFTIKSIEKVFPQAASPDVEIKKMKTRFNVDTEAPTKIFDEAKVRANDLSRIYKLEIGENASVSDAIADLASDSNVEFAEPNYMTTPTLIPNDPLFRQTTTTLNQWFLSNSGLSVNTKLGADVKALNAWNITRGSPSVVIAVVDSGIDYKHPDLGGGLGANYKVMGGYDFVNNDSDPMDDYGHGTHIAGIIAANTNNSKGVAGMCPSCKLMAVKFMKADGSGNVLRAADGISYAVNHGAKIISMSFGTYAESQTIKAAIDAAELNGVVSVAAAGNDHDIKKFYPAAFPNVISVAGTNQDDKKYDNSNYDNGVDHWISIAAPAGSLLSTALAGPGGACRSGTTDRYAYCSGTSMAAPVVAGIIGLYESLHPVTTQAAAVAIRTRIRSATYADNIDAINPTFKGKLGAGRANAYKFLTVGNSWCADSDWGSVNQTMIGYVAGNGVGCAPVGQYFDECYDHYNIKEGYCGASNSCVTRLYKCANGCSVGHCI
jgi:thermitase